jgi:hypothetical protein
MADYIKQRLKKRSIHFTLRIDFYGIASRSFRAGILIYEREAFFL